MLLWEQDERPVNEITQKLILNTNTVTPLLKRMEKQGFISRTKSTEDSRKVIIKLTSKGQELQEQAAVIPESLVKKIAGETIDIDALKKLKQDLDNLINLLNK
jgi:DNA-binding MarR family transcriptional regulator